MLSGGEITCRTIPATDENIGVYYSKGTGSSPVTNMELKMNLTDGDNSIGIYAADGINLVNTNSNITTLAGGRLEYIGASYVGGNSRH